MTAADRLCRLCEKPLPPLRGRSLGSRVHSWCRGAATRAKRLRSKKAVTEALGGAGGPKRGPDHPAWRGGKIPRRKTAAWARLSEALRAKSAFCCAWCGMLESENIGGDGIPRKLSLDHVRPYRIEGTDEAANLVPLCLRCHGKKGEIERKAFWQGDVLAQRQYEKAVR